MAQKKIAGAPRQYDTPTLHRAFRLPITTIKELDKIAKHLKISKTRAVVIAIGQYLSYLGPGKKPQRIHGAKKK